LEELEHKQLSLEVDKNLINKILDDINLRYIIIFLYIIRNELFKDLIDQNLIDTYTRILSRDEVDKEAINSYWSEDFIKVAIDLGLFRNIRSFREFKQKEDDFIVKFGDETITINENIIMTPADTLFRIISKKFKPLTKRDFNLALTRLKGVRCEGTGIIHPFIYEIGVQNYTLAEDLYNILNKYDKIYLAIKVEYTIETFYERFKETLDKVIDLIEIFDNILNRKIIIKKINKIIEPNNIELEFKKDEESKDKEERLNFSELTIKLKIPDGTIKLKLSNSNYQSLIEIRSQLQNISDQIIEMKTYYSTKEKKYNYLKYVESIIEREKDIQESLIASREEIKRVKSRLELIEMDIKEIKV